MKKYGLFGIQNYYPSGGWDDFITDFNNVYCLLKDEYFISEFEQHPLCRSDKLQIVNFMTYESKEIGFSSDIEEVEAGIRRAVLELTYETING